MRQIPQFEYDRALGSFRSWLRTLAVRRVIDRMRKTVEVNADSVVLASLDTEALRPTNTPSMVATDHTIGSESEYLWDVDDADRFAKLALRYPHLLTHEEQVRWKLIRETVMLWSGFPGDADRELDRTLRDAELHQSEQHVDHHRTSAGGARHRGQLFL